MKIFVKIVLGFMVIGLIVFNLNYSTINPRTQRDISLGIINSAAASGGEYYDEEDEICYCGAYVFKCIPIQEIASCNVGGQIPCSEACDD